MYSHDIRKKFYLSVMIIVRDCIVTLLKRARRLRRMLVICEKNTDKKHTTKNKMKTKQNPTAKKKTTTNKKKTNH